MSSTGRGKFDWLTDKQHREIQMRYQAGESVSDLAKEFGVTPRSINRWGGHIFKDGRPRAKLKARPGGTVASSFTMGTETRERLQIEADNRGLTIGRLVGNILDAIVEDDLIKAVLDEDDQ